jgi:hypothetical protein
MHRLLDKGTATHFFRRGSESAITIRKLLIFNEALITKRCGEPEFKAFISCDDRFVSR